jgi:hypothetical protein
MATVTASLFLEDVALVALGAACLALGGDGRKNAGLLSRWYGGEKHLPERDCAVGQWRSAGDSLRGGADCSDRCRQARGALLACLDAVERMVPRLAEE